MQISNLSVAYRHLTGVRSDSQSADYVKPSAGTTAVAAVRASSTPAEYVMEGEVLAQKRAQRASVDQPRQDTSTGSANAYRSTTFHAQELHTADLAIAVYQTHARLIYGQSVNPQLFDAYA